MNYAALVDAIQDYLEATDATFVANIPLFVQQAEERIYNTVQLANLRKNVTGVTSIGNKYLSCPGDFLSAYSMAVVNEDDEYRFLLNKDVNFIREAYPSPADTGLPEYYALFGPQSSDEGELVFILGPMPDAAYTVELHYYYYPESIVTATNTWLGDNFPSVLLYGALVEAYTFLKGEADLQAQYEKLYQNSLELLKNLGDGKQRRDAYRDGQLRVPVR